MALLEILLGLLAFGLGFGFRFLKVVPPIVSKIAGIIATVVLVSLFLPMLGLPAISLLQTFTAISAVMAVAIGYLLGDRLGDLF